jgi:hypothetical protein
MCYMQYLRNTEFLTGRDSCQGFHNKETDFDGRAR